MFISLQIVSVVIVVIVVVSDFNCCWHIWLEAVEREHSINGSVENYLIIRYQADVKYFNVKLLRALRARFANSHIKLIE